MKDISLFISQFLYRIRYWLVWGTLLVTCLVIYFTQFLPFSYTVEGDLFAGVTTSTSLTGNSVNYSSTNSTFDNLINLAQSRGTLEKVSMRLLANAFTYGEEWKDNRYIEAKHYRQLLDMTPKEVLALVDRKDVNRTLQALTDYRKEFGENFVYSMFNRSVPFYSYEALSTVIVKRRGVSDVLEIVYTSADPGITQQTVIILIEELKKAYEILRFKATNDVIAYFEEQVRIAKKKLNEEEDDLMQYCVQEHVINYGQESEALAHTRYAVDDRMEEALRAATAATALREMLDEKMDIRAQIIRNNTNLLNELEKVSTLNQNIMEQEIFTTEKSQLNSSELKNKKRALQMAEDKISHISDNLKEFNFSKEGVGIQDMVSEWLTALVNEAKANAEVSVLKSRQDEIIEQYTAMSPVGTQVSRKQRAIDIAEDNYRTQLSGLANAHLRLKDIEMNTSNLQNISDPSYPLQDNGRKRWLYVIIAFVGSLLFITTYFLLIELLDHTLRDAYRSKRLTKLPVIAAFNGTNNLKYRGFLRECNRQAAAYSCRQLNTYREPGHPTIINLFSIEPREGKSFLAKFFARHWEMEGLRVRIVSHEVDFEPHTPEYINAQELSDFWKLNDAEVTPDIILMEYPAASQADLPLPVLKKADVNLCIANACRLWRNSDGVLMDRIREAIGDTPLFLYLNNANREVVESFTGDLPPKTPISSFFKHLAQLGLTSRQAAVK